jgi:hypothetical protein
MILRDRSSAGASRSGESRRCSGGRRVRAVAAPPPVVDAARSVHRGPGGDLQIGDSVIALYRSMVDGARPARGVPPPTGRQQCETREPARSVTRAGATPRPTLQPPSTADRTATRRAVPERRTPPPSPPSTPRRADRRSSRARADADVVDVYLSASASPPLPHDYRGDETTLRPDHDPKRPATELALRCVVAYMLGVAAASAVRRARAAACS